MREREGKEEGEGETEEGGRGEIGEEREREGKSGERFLTNWLA